MQFIFYMSNITTFCNTCSYSISNYVKSKVVPIQDMKTWRRNRSLAVFILYHGTRCSRCFTSEERSWGSLNRRLSGPQNRYKYLGEQKDFASTRNQNTKLFIVVVCTLAFLKGNYLLYFSHLCFTSNTVQCTSQYFWQISFAWHCHGTLDCTEHFS
jgi:hypothetical protein